jgi:glycosyltransferase involved in cell wall biosynthesis
VLEQMPDAVFVWVGGGPLEAELRERVQTLGLEDSVRFAGQRNDVPDLMAAADLLVLPSLVEGLPLVVLEAMASGLPVVGTCVTGTSEAVVDDVTGRLVPPGRLTGPSDASELVAAISQVLQDPVRAARWGAAGRAMVERDFNAARMAAETAKVYQELL